MNKQTALLLLGSALVSSVLGCGDGGGGGLSGGLSCMDAVLGASCPTVGVECATGDMPNLLCGDDHVWHDNGPDTGDEMCTPPTPRECPTVMPVPGWVCDPCSDTKPCEYPSSAACGGVVTLTCADLNWTLADAATTCDCSVHTTEADCDADPFCRYLNAGCGMNEVPTTGCYPKADCAYGDCPDSTYCTLWNDNQCDGDACTCVEAWVCQ